MRLLSPPVVVLVTISVMIAGNRFIPVKEIIPPPYSITGYPVMLFGIAIISWAVYLMKPGSTPIHYGSVPQQLISSGPFRYSRNPIYLGFLCICLGIAIILGALSAFIILAIEWLIFNFILIPPEEKVLAEVLGESYLQYKRKIRRWL